MKKIIVFLMSFIMIFMIVGCNDSKCDHEYTSTAVEANCQEARHTLYTCTKCGHTYKDGFIGEVGNHVGLNQCTVCKISFFDTVADYVKEKGTKKGDCYSIAIYSSDKMVSSLNFYETDKMLRVESKYYESSGKAYLTIERDSAQHSWYFAMYSYEAFGPVNAATFSQYSTVTVEESTFPSSLSINDVVVTNMHANVLGFKVIIQLADEHLCLKNFGFEKYD